MLQTSRRGTSVTNLVTTENADDFHLQAYHASYRVSTPWAVSEKNCDTKEDKGKTMMCVLYILRYVKGTCWAEVTLNTTLV